MPHIPRRQPDSLSGNGNGYVYLIRMGDVYKIGLCRSWDRRRRAFSGMPSRVELLCLLRTNDPASLEATLHARYARRRLNGEWFALTPTEVQEILDHPNRVR